MLTTWIARKRVKEVGNVPLGELEEGSLNVWEQSSEITEVKLKASRTQTSRLPVTNESVNKLRVFSFPAKLKIRSPFRGGVGSNPFLGTTATLRTHRSLQNHQA
jgi:hypothetical protein